MRKLARFFRLALFGVVALYMGVKGAYSLFTPEVQEENIRKDMGQIHVVIDIPEEGAECYENRGGSFGEFRILECDNGVVGGGKTVEQGILSRSTDLKKAEADVTLNPGYYRVLIKYTQPEYCGCKEEFKTYYSQRRLVEITPHSLVKIHFQKDGERFYDDDEMIEIVAKREGEERRKEKVVEMKEWLEVFKGNKVHPEAFQNNADPLWLIDARQGSEAARAARVCRLFDQYYYGHRLKAVLEGKSLDSFEKPITLGDIGVFSEDEKLSALHKNVAKKAAIGLFAALRYPIQGMACSRGEGSFSLDNPFEVMDHLAWVMEGENLRPQKLGTSPKKIRNLLINAARREVGVLRGKGNLDELKTGIKDLLNSGYNFSPAELRLTKKEINLIGKARRGI